MRGGFYPFYPLPLCTPLYPTVVAVRKMEEEVQNLNGTTTNNANDIRVLSDNDAKLDARLEKIETEASALAEELAETQAGHDETLNKTVEDLAELKSDLIFTAEKLQATDDKRQEQVSIIHP